VRCLDQTLGNFVFHPWQADVEAYGKAVGTVTDWTQVHFGVKGDVTGQGHLHLAGHKLQCTEKTGRPTSGKQLLGVGAAICAARIRKLDIQPTIRGA
jgi:hypothetical protein